MRVLRTQCPGATAWQRSSTPEITHPSDDMKTSGGMQTTNLTRKKLGKNEWKAEGDPHTPGESQFVGTHLRETKQSKHKMGFVPGDLNTSIRPQDAPKKPESTRNACAARRKWGGCMFALCPSGCISRPWRDHAIDPRNIACSLWNVPSREVGESLLEALDPHF